MTKEEARQIIATWLVSSKGTKGQRGYIEGWFDEEDIEAFRMAIEALSVDAEGDLISRQDAIDAVVAEGRNVDSRYLESERIVHESDAVEALAMLPSADAKTKCVAKIEVDIEEIVKRIKEEYDIVDVWIPCSERLPKYSGTLCIVTIEGEDGARASLSYWQGNTHKWSDLGHYYKVTAWMPLPKPYKGGEDG